MPTGPADAKSSHRIHFETDDDNQLLIRPCPSLEKVIAVDGRLAIEDEAVVGCSPIRR